MQSYLPEVTGSTTASKLHRWLSNSLNGGDDKIVEEELLTAGEFERSIMSCSIFSGNTSIGSGEDPSPLNAAMVKLAVVLPFWYGADDGLPH